MMKSRSEYAVKTLTQKSTLGSIEAGRGNGSLVSDDALGGAAKPNAIASANAAITLTIRFADNFTSNNALFLAHESPFALIYLSRPGAHYGADRLPARKQAL